MHATEIVRRGYDALALKYHRQRDLAGHRQEVEDFLRRLPRKAKVLDAGCGSGKVAAVLLRRGLAVTGIDLSAGMLALAARIAPRATLLPMDMRALRFPREAFDGVLALYSLIHVPRRDHARVLLGFRRVLRPGGLLLVVLGRTDAPRDLDDFLGTPMYWSHYDASRNRLLLEEAGFAVLWSRLVGPRGDCHLWALARAPLTPSSRRRRPR